MSYTVDQFIKYKNANTETPNELCNYCVKPDEYNYRKKHITAISSTEIKVSLATHMSKRTQNGEDEQLYEKLQGLLNKLSNTNFSEIAEEIRELPYLRKKHIYKLSERIILKSINEPTFSETYAKLCQSLMPYYINDTKTNETSVTEKVYFRLALFAICEDIFKELTMRKSQQRSSDYERTCDYSKLKFSGLTKFLGELYNYDVMTEKIIYQCFRDIYALLLKNYDDYEPISVLVQTIMPKLYKTKALSLEKIKTDIETLLKEENGFKFPRSICKFKLLEIMETYTKLTKK